MTAAAKPVWPVPRNPIPMRARFAHSVPLFAGIIIERGRLCSCGVRFFPQWMVSKAWLDSLGQAKREFFLASCETGVTGGKTAHWFPRDCHVCVRRRM